MVEDLLVVLTSDKVSYFFDAEFSYSCIIMVLVDPLSFDNFRNVEEDLMM